MAVGCMARPINCAIVVCAFNAMPVCAFDEQAPSNAMGQGSGLEACMRTWGQAAHAPERPSALLWSPMCSYIEAFLRAADEVGVGACVTAELVNSTGAVQAWAQYHTLAPGPPPANISSTGGGGGGSGSSSGGSSGSGSPGSSSSGGSSGELPPADVESDWALSFDPVRCSTYTQLGQWVDDTQAWGETALR